MITRVREVCTGSYAFYCVYVGGGGGARKDVWAVKKKGGGEEGSSMVAMGCT